MTATLASLTGSSLPNPAAENSSDFLALWNGRESGATLHGAKLHQENRLARYALANGRTWTTQARAATTTAGRSLPASPWTTNGILFAVKTVEVTKEV